MQRVGHVPNAVAGTHPATVTHAATTTLGDAATAAAHRRAWTVLATVLDPEVPVLSIVDLGIVRGVEIAADDDGAHDAKRGVVVVLTPTYSGCPAVEAIDSAVVMALQSAGFEPVSTRLQRAPAWTTDWISEDARRRLREAGIAPPGHIDRERAMPITWQPRPVVACPQCDSADTERLSTFGSTACKALYRCRACREPFEWFKSF